MTVQEIYDMAICLIDEQDESDGTTLTDENMEYKFRTIPILNTALASLAAYNSNYTLNFSQGSASWRGRPNGGMLYHKQNNAADQENPNFDQDIPLDPGFAAALLPLYLAAQLMAAENPELADYFMAQYREVFRDLKSKIRAEFKPISTPYGLF